MTLLIRENRNEKEDIPFRYLIVFRTFSNCILLKQACPMHGPRATLWPVMLSNAARAWIKVDRELHCIYKSCNREINSYYSGDQIKVYPLTRTYT